jgi:hypothetical protein
MKNVLHCRILEMYNRQFVYEDSQESRLPSPRPYILVYLISAVDTNDRGHGDHHLARR